MPPRKSNVSAAPEEDSPAPESASKEPRDDTLSVEVCAHNRQERIRPLTRFTGPQPPQVDSPAPRERRPPTQHANPKRRCPRNVQERNRLRQLHHIMVRPHLTHLRYTATNPNTSAAEHAQRSGKKTVTPENVFAAMHELEFAFMLPRLEAEVTKFTSIQADKRNTYRKKVREEKKAVKDPVPGAPAGDGGEPSAKRARLDGEAGQSEDEGEGDVDDTADVEDDEVEDDEIEEDEEEGQTEGLVEDLLEEREEKDEDDEMGEGEESD
jgi:DNA polymerase epsilon subunit 3